MKSKVIGLIKKIALEFIIVVFLIGFLSASLQNYLLPKVHLTYPTAGYVVRTVPINGSIVPKEIKKLKLSSNTVIDELYVSYGKRITIGTPLFKVSGEYENIGNNLDELRAELKILQKNLEVYSINDVQSLDSKIKEVKEKIGFETNTLDGYKKMHNEGAISKNKLLDKQLEVKNLNSQLTTLISSKNESNLSMEIKKDKTILEIDRMKKQIRNLEELGEFYLSVDEDNICRSEVNGVIVGLKDVTRKDDTVFEIASMKDFSTVNYEAYVSDELRDYIRPGYTIKLYREDVNLGLVCIIRSICEATENGKLKVIAEFPTGVSGIPILNAAYDGRVERRKKVKTKMSLSAVLPHDKLQPNRKASIFAVEKKEGALSTTYQIKEFTVKIVDVGDDSVEISGSGISKTKYEGYVTNISNKIYDGVRVYSEEF